MAEGHSSWVPQISDRGILQFQSLSASLLLLSKAVPSHHRGHHTDVLLHLLSQYICAVFHLCSICLVCCFISHISLKFEIISKVSLQERVLTETHSAVIMRSQVSFLTIHPSLKLKETVMDHALKFGGNFDEVTENTTRNKSSFHVLFSSGITMAVGYD